MPPPLPNGSITHEAGLILYFLSFFPSPRIADVQFAVVGHDKYNFRTMCIEYTIGFSYGGRRFQRATLVTGSKTSKEANVLKDDCHIRIKAHDSDILSDFLTAKKS